MFSVGMVATQLKQDITNSAQTVRKAHLKNPAATGTLQDLVAHEVSSVGLETVRYDKKSGTIGLLWSKRAVEFIAVFLRLIATKAESAGQCAKDTYEVVLRKYHGWATAGYVIFIISQRFCSCQYFIFVLNKNNVFSVVKMALGVAPAKEEIYAKMGLGSDKKVAEALVLEMATILYVFIIFLIFYISFFC